MKVTAEPIKDRNSWDSVVKEVEGHALHLPIHWVGGTGSRGPIGILFSHRGKVAGAAIAYTLSDRLPSFLGGKRSLILPTSPAILHRRKDTDEIYQVLIEWARAEGYHTLSIHPAWGDDFSGNDRISPYVTDSILDFTIDLTGGVEAIQRGIHKKHRKNIRKAGDEGIQLEEDNSLQAFIRLREFQAASRQRSEERGNIYRLPSEAYFRKIHSLSYENGPGRILHAKLGGEYLASLAFLPFDDKAVTVRSGSVPKGYELGAAHLLQFELIRFLAETGFTRLNIGGVPAGAKETSHPNHGLYNFKRYFGGQENTRTGARIPLR